MCEVDYNEMMNMKLKVIAIGILSLLPLAACSGDKAPYYGQSESYDRTHLQFGSADLQANTRVQPLTATRDPAGLLHVTVQIRNVSDQDLYVDAFITFLRDGQPLEKLGPQAVTLKGNLFDTISFNSTQPATDYFVSLDYAK
jgi:hypothetical protein